jgi:hypothetical protein
MKKLFGYTAALLVVLTLPFAAFAADFRTGENPSVTTGEQVVNDVYMAGGNVTSAGSIEGDLITGGGTVTVSGPVSGDIIASGGTLTILSTVGDDLRVAGGTIVVQGSVGGDIIAAGGQITIGGPGVQGDLAIAGGSVRIDAPIAGNLKVGGGTVYINAPISGTVTIDAGEVTLGSKAVITGTLFYKAEKELTKEEGASVIGKVTFEKREVSKMPAAALAAAFSLFMLGKFLMLLVCTLTIGLVCKRFSKTAVTKAVERPLLELGRGLLALAALPALSVVALITIIGIPFGVLGILSFITLLLLAWIVAPIVVGSVVYRYFSKRDSEISWKTILLGVVLYSIVGMIPLLGGLVQGLLTLLTLGVLVAISWEAAKQWK